MGIPRLQCGEWTCELGAQVGDTVGVVVDHAIDLLDCIAIGEVGEVDIRGAIAISVLTVQLMDQ